jgi:hypothetical protein
MKSSEKTSAAATSVVSTSTRFLERTNPEHLLCRWISVALKTMSNICLVHHSTRESAVSERRALPSPSTAICFRATLLSILLAASLAPMRAENDFATRFEEIKKSATDAATGSPYAAREFGIKLPLP